MKSLLIVELNSTKIRFLKINNSSSSVTLARKPLNFNKNLTKELNYNELQKVNEYIKNTIDKRFLEYSHKQVYISESFSPLYLTRSTNSLCNREKNILASKLSIKHLGAALKAKTAPDELKFVLYDDKIYVSYRLEKRYIIRVFLLLEEFKPPKQFSQEFLNRLILFEFPYKFNKISVFIDADFYIKSYSYRFLSDFFKKAALEIKIIDFMGYLHSK